MLATYTTLAEQLEKHYTLFTLNRKYKATQWKDDEKAYLDEQEKTAQKINEISREIEKKIREDLKKFWADAEVIAYDSRTFNIIDSMLGSLLVKGLKKQSDCLDLQAAFFSAAGYKIKADRLEDLDKKTQEEVLAAAKKETSNGD